jgi:hypothetical protein
VAGRILLIVVPSDAERAVFNTAMRQTTHRSIYAIGPADGFTRFVEARPDLVLLPMSDASQKEQVAINIRQMQNEPCGKDIPIILYDSSKGKLKNMRAILKLVGASAFIPWPPRTELLNKAISVLTQEPSTDSAVQAIQEEATSEITIDGEAKLEIDPLLEQAARAHDEADEIPTNPRQPVAQEIFSEPQVEVPSSTVDLEHPTKAELLDPASQAALELIHLDSSSKEGIPVFRAPSGLEPTPVKFVQALVSEESVHQESISDGSLSVPEFLREPELPLRDPTSSKLSTTAKKRIEEIPRGGAEDSVSQKSHPLAELQSDPAAAGRKGLDESRLGKRLVRRINKTHGALDTLDYYELMGVDRSASGKTLKDAYFALSLEFHPDRFFLMTSGSLKEKIYVIFRRIGEAYVVLSDERRRETYDEGLSGPKVLTRAVTNERGLSQRVSAPMDRAHALSVETSSPQAENFVRRAQWAYNDHDFDGARLYLSLAAVCEPQSVKIKEAIKIVLSKRPALNSCRRW